MADNAAGASSIRALEDITMGDGTARGENKEAEDENNAVPNTIK